MLEKLKEGTVNFMNSKEQDFLNLFNTLQDSIFIIDLEGNILFYNEHFGLKTGNKERNLKNRSVTEFYSAFGREEIEQAINEAKEGKVIINKIPFLNSQGIEVAVESRFVAGEWEGNEVVIGTCRDISETIKYEEQIKESSERLEMVLLASDAGWWDWKVNSDNLTLNDKWCAMRGYKPDEIPPHVESWKSLVHPEDLPLALERLEKHFRNETPFYQAEYRAKTKWGGYIWILDTGKVIEVDENGSPARVVGTNIDINTHKLNEIKLQKNLRQQELLSEIALELNSLDNFEIRINKVLEKVGVHNDVSRVYIFEDNSNGLATSNTFEWCNIGIEPQIQELQDVPYEMIPSFRKIMVEDGRIYSENIAELPEDLRAILEPQGIKSIVIYPLNIQGASCGFIGFDECVRNKKWTKSELELLRTFSGIIANTYERRISEISLQESEARNSAILESIPDILFQFSRDGKILSYRGSSDEDLMIQPDKFLNKDLKDLFPPEFSSSIMNAIDLCLSSGSYRFDYEMKVRDVQNDYEARMARMNENEVIAIVRNVSERKNYERQLTEERDRANQANKAKSEFLANMSHEIRTPMNAILGFSEALYHKTESAQHQKILKSILNSGNLLLSLLNDILDLSKIEAGMMELSQQPVDLTNILKEIRMLFQSKAEVRNVAMNVHLSVDFPKLLLLDEIRIKQVIFNLVGNAIKFTHTGYVNIRADFESDGSTCGKLRMDVEDTGIGIPQSQQDIIFESFQQQSGQSNRIYEGAGLGLAISKRLVEKMHGKITVKSEVGKGSCFTFIIPCSQLDPVIYVPQNDISEQKIEFEPAQLLIVDDVKSNIEAIESLLEGTNLKVLSAKNGEMALEILKYTRPDLIMMDLRMPVMNGYDAARIIKEDRNLAKVPIIAFTASVFGSEHGIKSGNFNSFLYKPVSRASLFRELMRFLKYKSMDVITSQPAPREISSESLPQEVVSKLPEIYDFVMAHLYPLWEGIKDQLVLFKIEEFASELLRVSTLYKFEFLANYAGRLREELEMVDLEAIRESLQEFPKIVSKISELIQDR